MLTDSELLEIYKNILDVTYDGIVVTDSKGFIEYMNNSFAKVANTTPQEAVGKYAAEVIENTRMHMILKTGRAEIGEVQKIGDRNAVVMRIPIFKDGKLVRVIGKLMFEDVKELNELKNKVDRLLGEIDFYKKELYKARSVRYDFDKIKGKSQAISDAKGAALRAAKSSPPTPVLLIGENGTGKDMFAQAIHVASNRGMGPFVKISCEAETDFLYLIDNAYRHNYNKLDIAQRGSLYLDEAAALQADSQLKLLEVVSDPENDIRYITSTSTDLAAAVESGEFNEELYYRLSVIVISIPPLRNRIEDIPLLCEDIIYRLNSEMGFYTRGISDQAMRKLMAYHWPGNVRELQNTLERALNLMDEKHIIRERDIEFTSAAHNVFSSVPMSEKGLKNSIGDVERHAIINALEQAGGNKSEAARILKISRSSFYHKLKVYGINE